MIVPGQLIFFDDDNYHWCRLYIAVNDKIITYLDCDIDGPLVFDTEPYSTMEELEQCWARVNNLVRLT